MAQFKSSEGRFFHGLALLYAVSACSLGLAGIVLGNTWINIAATLLLAHGMVIAAYLVHECGHNTVFTDNADNARAGSWLTWLCGASYGTYEDIRYKHFRHHVDNDDVVWFDYEAFFARHRWFYRLTIKLEYLYIPAHDLLMHFIMVFSSFIIPRRRNQRARQRHGNPGSCSGVCLVGLVVANGSPVVRSGLYADDDSTALHGQFAARLPLPPDPVY